MTGNKIFKKIFFMILGFGFAILFIQFLFQYFLLDDFYAYSREISIKNELSQVAKLIESEDSTNADIEKKLIRLNEETNSFNTIVDGYSVPIFNVIGYDKVSYMTILTEENEVYQVYLDQYWDNQGLLDSLKKGKSLSVKGFIGDYAMNDFYPEWITVDGKEYGVIVDQIDISTGDIIDFTDIEALPYDETDEEFYQINEEDPYLLNDEALDDFNQITDVYEGPIVIEGIVSSINIPDLEDYGTSYRENQLFDEQLSFFSEDKDSVRRLQKNGYVSYKKIDTYTGIENMISIRMVKDPSGEALYIFNILSLQSVNEATGIMQSFFYFTVIIAFLLAIIVSYFFSKKITEPLIHLDMVTKRLANIDFSQRCEVTTNDEIQDLADNINVMSERLENTLKQLKQFLADASHELKTPLTVMRGIVEGMMDGVYDVKDPEHYKRMHSEINDMSQLVYDLLELSKLESGEVSFKEEVFQLSDVILKTHHKLSPLVKEKELTVSLSLDEQFVRGNEPYITTVIRNYYTNAIQYTAVGGVITIEMLELDNQCQFVIENSPSHIDESALEKLWQPFFREEQSRNKALGGTGLGLYMIKEILDKHKSLYSIKNTTTGVKASFTLGIEISNDL